MSGPNGIAVNRIGAQGLFILLNSNDIENFRNFDDIGNALDNSGNSGMSGSYQNKGHEYDIYRSKKLPSLRLSFNQL
jgi:hypothetical protein